jgi:hypothetical protein
MTKLYWKRRIKLARKERRKEEEAAHIAGIPYSTIVLIINTNNSYRRSKVCVTGTR